MKTVFFVQDFNFNKNINYHIIAEAVKAKLYLLAYHTNEEHLSSYIQQHYPNAIFEKAIAFKMLEELSIKENIEQLCAENNINADFNIITNAESAVAVCGRLRQFFKIDNDDMVRYVDKIAMKKSLENKIAIPKYVLFSNSNYQKDPDYYLQQIQKTLGLPLFIKPTNQYSSRGTTIIYQLEDFSHWHKQQTEQNSNELTTIEIDEMVNGTLYHCDAFIKKGKILHTVICEYLYPCYDFILGKPLGGFILSIGSSIFAELNDYNKKVLSQMGLPNGGLTHLEVFKRPNGELIFLEVAARPAGAQIPRMYQKSFNISIREAHILLQIDDSYNPTFTQNNFGAYVSYPKKPGTVIDFNRPEINSEHQIIWDIKLGDKLIAPDKISDVAGSILLWNRDFNQLSKDINYLRTFTAFRPSVKLCEFTLHFLVKFNALHSFRPREDVIKLW